MRKGFILKFFRNSQNWQSLNANVAVGRNSTRALFLSNSSRSSSSGSGKNNKSDLDHFNCIKKVKKMYKQSGTNLLNEPKEKVLQWLDSFDSVITDCDGVLWIYSNAIDGSVETINCFNKLGKRVFFCTNNSTKSRIEILQKANAMGFMISPDDVISTAHSAAAYLKSRNFDKKVYVIGAEGITRELDKVDIKHTSIGPDVMNCSLAEYLSERLKLEEDIGAVLIGFDEHFSFPKMAKAASYLMDPNCLFIATNTDERFPMPNMVIPGTGSFVRAVATCAEREPIVIGKPNPGICEWLIKQNLIKPERTLMIGDRCNTDILLGYNCGFQTLLVGTGIHNLNDVESWKKSDKPELHNQIPDTYLPKLGDILQFIGP